MEALKYSTLFFQIDGSLMTSVTTAEAPTQVPAPSDLKQLVTWK